MTKDQGLPRGACAGTPARYLLPAMTDPRRFPRATLVLICAALVVYLMGNAAVPLWDRDEPRYAQCSRQMLQTGDWVLPRYLDDLRMAKPPLIYWLQAASMSVLGETSEAARLPSVIGMVATLLLLAVAVRRELSAEHAFWAVLVLGTSVMAVVSAKACLTDAVLLLFVTTAQLCLYRIWTGRGTWPTVVVLGLAVGLTLLTKGPVGLGIHVTTFLAYGLLTWSLRWGKKTTAERDGTDVLPGTGDPSSAVLGYERKPVRAADDLPPRDVPAFTILAKVAVTVLTAIAVCIPWVVLVEHRWAALPADVRAEAAAKGSDRKRAANPGAQVPRGDQGYIWTTIEKEVVDRSKTAQEGHKGPPGYYLGAIWGIFLPWSLILPATLVLAWRRRHVPHVRFALAAVLGPWLMFEFVQTKLPHYLLPCFVPLAVLSADAIVQCLRHGVNALSDRGFRRGVVAWGVVMVLFGLAPWLAAVWFRPQPWAALAAVSVVTAGYVAFVARAFLAGQTQRGLVTMGLGALLLLAVLFRAFLPSAEYLKLSVRTADVLTKYGVTGRGQAVMLDYKEPSLAFYQGGSIREHSATIVTPRLLEIVPAEWFVVTRDVWENSAPKRPDQPDARPMLDVVATFVGLDVADGMRGVEVMVTRRKRTPAATVAPTRNAE